MAKITDIQPQKKNKNRSSLFVNEQYFMGASNYVIQKYKLAIGQEIDEKKIKEILIEDNLEKAKAYVVDYLLNKTKKGVKDKLKEKGYDEEVIHLTMDFIEKYHLLDDQDYAKRKAHDSLFLQKQGKNRIKQTLKQKGVSDETIQQTLNEIPEEEEIKMAKKALQNKIEGYKKKAKNEYDLKNKCYQFLLRKGYSSRVISQVLHIEEW